METMLYLVEVNDKLVVVQHLCQSPLNVACNPEFSMDDAYYTVTRGSEHIFTIVKTSGKTLSFHFGESGHTLISKPLEALKERVLAFLEEKEVFIGLSTPIREFCITPKDLSDANGETRLFVRGCKGESQELSAPTPAEAEKKAEAIAGKNLEWVFWSNDPYFGWKAEVR